MSHPNPNPNPGIDPNQHPYGQQNGQPSGAQPQYGQPPQTTGAEGSRYGTQAYAPQAQYGVMQEPKKYRTLLTLTLASLGLYVLNLLLSLLMTGDEKYRSYVEGTATSGGTGMSADELEQFSSVMNLMMIGSIVVSGLLGIALYLLVYFGLKKKKGWARILGIVFAILGTLGTVSSLLSVGMMASGPLLIGLLLISLAVLVVNVLWLIHAFNSQVAEYFRQQSAMPAVR